MDLTELAIARARAALRDSNPDDALKWLDPIPTDERPRALEAEIRHSAAKLAASNGEWHRCEREFESVRRLDPDPFYERRLALVRRHGTLLDHSIWQPDATEGGAGASLTVGPSDAGGVECVGLRRVPLQRSRAGAPVEPFAS